MLILKRFIFSLTKQKISATHEKNITHNLEILLTPQQYDLSWAIAQAKAISQYIEYLLQLKLISSNEQNLTRLTQNFIFDFMDLNSWLRELSSEKTFLPSFYDPSEEDILADIKRSQEVMSSGAFEAEKQSCFDVKKSPIM